MGTLGGSGALKAVRGRMAHYYKSIWFFPAALLLVVIILGLLQISGSSIGIYHQLFYGDSKDGNLLLNEPRAIRSDEWLVTTQLSIAQTKTSFAATNENIGNGIDVSLLVDAPTTDVIQLFKPHNWAFFVLPVGIAFALKWWLLAYLLVVSVYFFVLALLPGRKQIAVLLSLCFLASPFIAWWYQYITLATIYYTLFGIVVALKLMQSNTKKHVILWALLLAYIATSFALVLYPPFQIPCALFALAILTGYTLDNRSLLRKNLKLILLGGGLAITVGAILTAMCLVPKLPVVETVSNTAYPGNRITESGDYNPVLFLANNTQLLTQSDTRAAAFSWIANQSEGSSFILVFVLAIPLLTLLIAKYRRNTPYFWTASILALLAILYVAWLFIPGIDLLGKITLLNRVPHERLLIGFGLINLAVAVILIKLLETKRFTLPRYSVEMYTVILLVIYAGINFYIAKTFPDFMGERWAALLVLPYPVIIYLFLKRWYSIALLALLVFSIGSVMFIHPLYKGVGVLNDSDLSKAIREVDEDGSKRWVTDSLQLENYALVNGKQSLAGVYVYPDLELWKSEFSTKDADKYNRYSHVHFRFDRNEDRFIDRQLNQPSPDQLTPVMEPCDAFLKDNNVGYLLTAQEFTSAQAPCAKLIRQLVFPRANIYIYRVSF